VTYMPYLNHNNHSGVDSIIVDILQSNSSLKIRESKCQAPGAEQINYRAEIKSLHGWFWNLLQYENQASNKTHVNTSQWCYEVTISYHFIRNHPPQSTNPSLPDVPWAMGCTVFIYVRSLYCSQLFYKELFFHFMWLAQSITTNKWQNWYLKPYVS
jgi:hypothetical protein